MNEIVVRLTTDHRYVRSSDDREIRSVSKVLRKAGIRPAPYTGYGRRGDAVRRGLKRGADVHRLTRSIDETYDEFAALDDVFDPTDLSLENVDYVAAYQRFLKESGYRPIAWEVVLYHPLYDYAGRADMIGWLGGHKRIMADRKTDRSLHKAVWLQLAAYREAWNYFHPTELIDQTFALVLKSNTLYDLVPNPLEPGDFPFFAGAIWVARWNELTL